MLAQCPALLWHTQYVGLLKNKNNSNENKRCRLMTLWISIGSLELLVPSYTATTAKENLSDWLRQKRLKMRRYVQILCMLLLGHSHIRQSVLCLSMFDPQSPVCWQVLHGWKRWALARCGCVCTSTRAERRHRCDCLWRIHLKFRHQHTKSG